MGLEYIGGAHGPASTGAYNTPGTNHDSAGHIHGHATPGLAALDPSVPHPDTHNHPTDHHHHDGAGFHGHAPLGVEYIGGAHGPAYTGAYNSPGTNHDSAGHVHDGHPPLPTATTPSGPVSDSVPSHPDHHHSSSQFIGKIEVAAGHVLHNAKLVEAGEEKLGHATEHTVDHEAVHKRPHHEEALPGTGGNDLGPGVAAGGGVGSRGAGLY